MTEDTETGGTKLVRLRDMEPGTCGTIDRLACGGKLKRRLMDMGVVSGTPVELVRFAPLGDPLELKLMGFNLSLRCEEAGDIWVEVEPADEKPPEPELKKRRRHRTRRHPRHGREH